LSYGGVTATVYFFPNFGNARITARIAHLVVPGIPHHVTQRCNRRERTFSGDADYRLYRDWLGIGGGEGRRCDLAYCLMPNHVHAVVTSKDEEGCGTSPTRDTGGGNGYRVVGLTQSGFGH